MDVRESGTRATQIGRPPSQMDGRGFGGEMQALEDGSNDRGIGDHGNQVPAAVAVRAFQEVDLEHPSQEFRH